MTVSSQNFIEISDGFFVDEDYVQLFESVGIISLDSVFNFSEGDDLVKSNMAKHRSRIRFEAGDTGKAFYLKRYDNVPAKIQIKNWLNHGQKRSTSAYDHLPCDILRSVGINPPKTVAYGEEWNGFFEKRSFIISEEIYASHSLEKRLPDYFYGENTPDSHSKRVAFIERLADLARTFHESGLRHRDFYLAHIFLTKSDELYLIDLHRCFTPKVFGRRYQVKDIAQLHYSAPGQYISCADRLRFYRRYTGRKRLTRSDRTFIRQVKAKAWRMADHDIKHNRVVPFAS